MIDIIITGIITTVVIIIIIVITIILLLIVTILISHFKNVCKCKALNPAPFVRELC